MNPANTPLPHCISLDAAEAMTGISRRTLWRRVADGALVSGPDKDARGRTTLQLDGLLEAAREHTGLALGADQLNLLLQADAGQATAQAELGALMQLSGKTQGGGGEVSIGYARRRSRVRPMPCTGWAWFARRKTPSKASTRP